MLVVKVGLVGCGLLSGERGGGQRPLRQDFAVRLWGLRRNPVLHSPNRDASYKGAHVGTSMPGPSTAMSTLMAYRLKRDLVYGTHGTREHKTGVQSEQECCALCMAESDCAVATYLPANEQCWFKVEEALKKGARTLKGAVSCVLAQRPRNLVNETCAAIGLTLALCDRSSAAWARKPAKWLHIPKTGTSFSIALEEARVAGLINFTGKTVGHAPMQAAGWARSSVAMLVREPIDRVASAFLHDQHACEGQQRAVRELAGTKSSPKIYCNATDLHVVHQSGMRVAIPKHLILEYARCVEGCMANMLTGRQCNDASGSPGGYSRRAPHVLKQPQPTESERRSALEAAGRLAVQYMKHSVSFVGLTSRWSETVCRWRSQTACAADARQSPSTGPFSNRIFRNSNPGKSPGCEAPVKAILEAAQWRDEADEAVFKAAIDRIDNGP